MKKDVELVKELKKKQKEHELVELKKKQKQKLVD